jgi:hypothetical protein
MTRENLWAIYAKKNPSFNLPDKQVTMSAIGLKKLFDQTWDLARRQGIEEGKNIARGEKSVFERVFGNKV